VTMSLKMTDFTDVGTDGTNNSRSNDEPSFIGVLRALRVREIRVLCCLWLMSGEATTGKSRFLWLDIQSAFLCLSF
jgi:hypothetical protein